MNPEYLKTMGFEILGLPVDEEASFGTEETVRVNRLFYLASLTRDIVPAYVSRWLPPIISTLVSDIPKEGLVRVADKYQGTSLTLLQNKVLEGKNLGTPAPNEFKNLIATLAAKGLLEAVNSKTIDMDTFLRYAKGLDAYKNAVSISGTASFDANEVNELPDDLFIQSSFPFVSGLLGGLPAHSFGVVAARPKTGKSVVSLALAWHMLEEGIVDEVDFYENEYPEAPMRAYAYWGKRSHPTVDSSKFHTFVGPVTTTELFEKYAENPNPRRLVIIDSADWMVGSHSEIRHEFGSLYMELLRLRPFNRFVITTSQINRAGSSGSITMENLAESDKKAQLVDWAIGIRREPEEHRVGNTQILHANVIAQRYGGNVSSDNHVSFFMDYHNLTTTPIDFSEDY